MIDCFSNSQEQFRLSDEYNIDDPYVREVFNNSAHKTMKAQMYKAQLKAVIVYYKHQGNYCDIDTVKKIHLTAE
jgi:adenylate kinase family enzyme